MPQIIKESRLIKVEQTNETNSYKYWTAQLFDDGTVKAEWGRVGAANPQSGEWSGGESYLDKKVKEKTKKGYVEQKTIGAVSSGNSTVKSVDLNLQHIAKSELVKDTSNKTLVQLVDRLLKSNVHKITSTTNVTFNNTTGLFQTPLGIVTPEGISEARDILAEINHLVKDRKFNTTLNNYVNKFVLIIPQNLGMKRFSAETVFPDETAVQKQSDILDSLEASYLAMTSNNSSPTTTSNNSQSKVFNVNLEIADSKEADRLIKWYETSKKTMHGYDRVKVRNVFSVKIEDMDKAFLNSDKNITEVFHGTSEANCLSILKSGLKVSPPSTAAIAGKMFGNGIYGAINSSKSLGYTYGKWGQGGVGAAGWLFVCNFAMGKQYETRAYGCSKPSGYDSVWAKASSGGLYHDELIVYTNNRVNIRYLLECQ